MDHSIDPIERSQLHCHFDELVDYLDRPIQTPPNLGFLMKIHLKPEDLTICINHDPVSIHTIFPDTIEVNIDVSQRHMIMGRNSLVPVVYPMTSRNQFVDTLDNNIINDSVQIDIPKQVMDVHRTCSISNWTSEPYHQNLYLVEWDYRTIKLWTSNVKKKSYVPSNYGLLCINYVCYLPYSKDLKIPDHRLNTDAGERGSSTGPSEGS